MLHLHTRILTPDARPRHAPAHRGARRFARPALALVLASSAVLFVGGAAQAQPLTGSGLHLAIPNPNPGVPIVQTYAISNVVPGTSFDGTWSTPALPAWVGTFAATGPVPASGNLGTTRYDFTTLPLGELPIGTYFIFGDLDNRGADERIILRAFNASNQPINGPWLNLVSNMWGSGSGGPGSFVPSDVPGWAHSGNTYLFNGMNVTSSVNPNIAFSLLNNTAIAYLEVQKFDALNSFSLAAPIPAPASAALLSMLGLAVARRRRR